MNNDPISYISEEQTAIPGRPQVTSRGMAGFLVAKGLVSTTQQANVALALLSLALILAAIIIPFVW